jgi:hypothetical protein
MPRSRGLSGVGALSSAPAAPIGNDEPAMKPGCSTSKRAIAKQFATSERLLYYAAELGRSDRQDLMAAVVRGELKLTAAIRELRGTTLPDRYGKLVQAWNRCDEDERARFLTALEKAGMVTRSRPMPE